MRLTKKRADNGRCYLSGLSEVSNIYSKGYGRIQIGDAVEKLAEYEDLEEQGKLLIMAYEICIVSECNHCNYVKRRIEETWIQPELLSHDGFYKTKEEAEAALKELERGKGE